MSEKTNFVFFFENKRRLPLRRVFINKMLAGWSVWSNLPTTVYLLNYETSKEDTESWEKNTLLSRQLGEAELLTVYAEPKNIVGFINSVSITEQEDIVVYDFAFEKSQLLQYPISDIENQIIKTFQIAMVYTPPVLFVGSEAGWQEGNKTAEIVVEKALNPSNENYWVMAKEEIIPPIQNPFEVVTRLGNYCLLRRHNLLVASNFKM